MDPQLHPIKMMAMKWQKTTKEVACLVVFCQGVVEAEVVNPLRMTMAAAEEISLEIFLVVYWVDADPAQMSL